MTSEKATRIEETGGTKDYRLRRLENNPGIVKLSRTAA
jgi:hypothetical protein